MQQTKRYFSGSAAAKEGSVTLKRLKRKDVAVARDSSSDVLLAFADGQDSVGESRQDAAQRRTVSLGLVLVAIGTSNVSRPPRGCRRS